MFFLLLLFAFSPNEGLRGTLHNYWNLNRINNNFDTYWCFFLKYACKCAFVWDGPHLKPNDMHFLTENCGICAAASKILLI